MKQKQPKPQDIEPIRLGFIYKYSKQLYTRRKATNLHVKAVYCNELSKDLKWHSPPEVRISPLMRHVEVQVTPVEPIKVDRSMNTEPYLEDKACQVEEEDMSNERNFCDRGCSP